MSNANEPDQVSSGVLGVILVLVSLAVLAIALFVTSLVREEVDLTSEVRGAGQDRKAVDLKNSQLAALGEGPSFADRATGLVQIPIDRAMAITLEAVRENPYALSPGAPPDDGMGGAGPTDGEATDEKSKDKKAKDAESKDKKKGPLEKKPSAQGQIFVPAPAPGPAPGPAPVAPPAP